MHSVAVGLMLILSFVSVKSEGSRDVLKEISSTVVEDLIKSLKNISMQEHNGIVNYTEFLKESASNTVRRIEPKLQDLISTGQLNPKDTVSKLMDMVRRNPKVQKLSVSSNSEDPAPRSLCSQMNGLLGRINILISSKIPTGHDANTERLPINIHSSSRKIPPRGVITPNTNFNIIPPGISRTNIKSDPSGTFPVGRISGITRGQFPTINQGRVPVKIHGQYPAISQVQVPTFNQGHIPHPYNTHGQRPAFPQRQVPIIMNQGHVPANTHSQNPGFSQVQVPTINQGHVPAYTHGQRPAFPQGHVPCNTHGQNPIFPQGQVPAINQGHIPLSTHGQYPAITQGLLENIHSNKPCQSPPSYELNLKYEHGRK